VVRQGMSNRGITIVGMVKNGGWFLSERLEAVFAPVGIKDV